MMCGYPQHRRSFSLFNNDFSYRAILLDNYEDSDLGIVRRSIVKKIASINLAKTF